MNCCAPADVAPAIAIARAVTNKPVIVYPSSGEQCDTHQRRWIGPSHYSTAQATRWIAAGAAVVGGCCRVRPSDIAAITDVAHTAAHPG